MKIASGTAAKLFARGANAGESMTFAGEPALLEADVWLHNEEAEDLNLRRATVTSKALQRHLPAQEITRISVPPVAPAHQRKWVSTSFDVGPSITQGTYAEIRLEGDTGSESFSARIIVTHEYVLSRDPDGFVLTAGAGVITNEHVTVQPDHWELVNFNVRLSASLAANAHLRAHKERFNLDLVAQLETASVSKPRSLGAKKKSD